MGKWWNLRLRNRVHNSSGSNTLQENEACHPPSAVPTRTTLSQSPFNSEMTSATRAVTLDEIHEDDIVIALIGTTGVGKTTFIKALAGAHATWLHIGHGLGAGTIDISCVKVHIPELDANFVLVDTPGFDDPVRPDSRILEIIATWLEKACRKGRLLSGIIYLHRITDIRFDTGALSTLIIFRKMYGGVGYERVVLVTTRWNTIPEADKVELRMAEQREEHLISETWSILTQRAKAASVARFSSTPQRARQDAVDVLRKLVDNEAFHELPTKLRIQQEMVDKGISLPRTEAGKSVFSTLETMDYYLRQLKGIVNLSQ